tara:strand:- start:5801 stop:10768 length:4968 start_codon:yes stop_codon:yes gene_type:complete
MAKIINTEAKSGLDKNKSFALLRTNPKLTSNIKLVADSSGDIYLSSIKASRDLAQSSFQKHALSESGQYNRDVAIFYGKLPKDKRYEVGREHTDLAISKEYSTQYENLYNYGASFNYTKVYGEQYRIFSPIWLEDKVPQKYVIYRIEDVDFDKSYLNNASGQNHRIQEMLSKATIIKTFDLTNNSKLGKYLNSHINDPLFPKSHVTFNFELDDPTYFSGIDSMIGGFVKKSDYIDDDYIREDLPEILANNTITSSFERNGLVSANVFNLEFLFDDHDAKDYNIYRYFGLYVDEHVEGEVLVDNVTRDGMLYISGDSSINGDPQLIPTVSETSIPMLSWVKDKNGDFHHVRNTFGSRNSKFLQDNFRGINTSFNGDKEKFTKKIENEIQVPVISKDPFNGFIRFKLTSAPVHNDKIFLGDLLEISIENFNLGDFIFIADETMPIGTYSEGRYSCQGNTSQIAAAIAGSIRNGEIIPYNAQSFKNEIIIDDYSQGRNKYTTVFGVNASNPYTFLDTSDCVSADLFFEKRYNEFINEGGTITGGLQIGDYKIFTMSGGCSVNQGITISSSDVGLLTVGDYVKHFRKEKYTRIEEIIKDPVSDNFRVIFENKVIFSNTNLISTYKIYMTQFGKFEGYDIKDFDFDFYSTINSDISHLTLESKNYLDDESNFSLSSAIPISNDISIVTPPSPSLSNQVEFDAVAWTVVIDGLDIRPFLSKGDFLRGVDEQTQSGSNITYTKISTVKWVTGSTYASGGITIIRLKEEPNSTLYNIPNNASDKTFVFKRSDNNIKLFSFKNLSNVIEDDSSEIDEQVAVDIKSEYDRLNENSLKETSVSSRVIPTICKFALKNGVATNARNLPYILNVNEAFGVDNLSPDISVASDRDSDKLNMEHFLIWNIPPYLKTSSSVPLLRDYVNPEEDAMYFPQVTERLKNIEYDYFSSFLTYIGAHVPVIDLGSISTSNSGSQGLYNPFDPIVNTLAEDDNWADSKTRRLYTVFTGGDSLGFASTVFKGLRYIYKDRKEFSLSNPISFQPSSGVNGYKYSTVLCYTNNPATGEERYEAKTEFEFIKNEKFKTLTLVIHVSLPNNNVDFLDIYQAYTLKDIVDSSGDTINSKVRGFIEFGGVGGGSNWAESTTQVTNSLLSVGFNSTKFTEDIFKIDEEYSYLVFQVPGLGGQNTIYSLKVVSVIDDENIIVAGTPGRVDTSAEAGYPEKITIIEYLNETDTSNIGNGIELEYHLGGKRGWENVLSSVVAPGMAEKINTHDNIKYTTISEDGVESDGLYCMEIQDGVELIKTSILDIETDEDKPKSFKLNNDEIGHDLVAREDGGYYTNLRRMNGEYDPLFKSVIEFTAPYRHKKLTPSDAPVNRPSDEYIRQQRIYNRLSEVNCVFSSYLEVDDNYGIISNFFYHKVNEEGGKVLKLDQSTDKPPLYPLIGEIAIDKRDLNLFDSKYSSNYYTRSYEGGKYKRVSGTLSPIEERSFFASTIMKVKDQYDITAYSPVYINSLEELDIIRYDEKENQSAYVFEDSQKIYIDFYIMDSIINELIEDEKLISYYSKYVKAENSYGDKTSLRDDTVIYIKDNIIPRFELDEIFIYGKPVTNENTELDSVVNLEDIMSDGYLPLTNFEVRRFAEKPLDFRLIYNKKPGYNYKFRVHAKIIA